MANIRVLLVDDHGLFIEGLAMIISSQPDMVVVGEASDGLEAVIKAEELAPDLILMDIQMPGMDGIEATRRIKKEVPSATIVMLTVRDDEEKLFEAVKNGAQGYLLKKMQSPELIDMMRRALAGEVAIPPRLAGQILEEFRRLSQLEPRQEDGTAELSPRELGVLNLVAQAKSDKEIALELVGFLDLLKRSLGCLQQASIFNGNGGMRGSNGQQRSVMFVEDAIALIDSLQHTDCPILDWHGHTEQGLDLEFDVIRDKQIMTWVLFGVVQNQMLIRAEDRPGQTVVDRDGNFRQSSGVGSGSSSKIEAWLVLLIQKNRGGFTV